MVPDPAGLAAVDITNPQTWNRYAYLANNPLNAVDPVGLHCTVNTLYGGITPGSCGSDSGFGSYDASMGYLGGYNDPSQDGKWVPWDSLYTISVTVTDGVLNALRTLQSRVCSALPNGSVDTLQMNLGGITGPTFTLENVKNFDTGASSMFFSMGVNVGWNGGGSGSLGTGAVWGLYGNNSNYSDGFTTVSGAVGYVGGFASASSGGLNGNPIKLSTPTVLGATIGASSPLAPVSAGISVTDYSMIGSLPSYANFAPGELVGSLARQVVCHH